jgi:tripartite-type tricarboxylate transporter receptor subunit TctC
MAVVALAEKYPSLIDAARKKSLKAALSGIGSIDHLLTLLLEKHAGLKKVTTVPFGGGGPATAAVIKEEVDFFTGLSITSVRFVKAGTKPSPKPDKTGSWATTWNAVRYVKRKLIAPE